MELPIELTNLIVSLVGAGVTFITVQGFKALGSAFDRDLSKYAKMVSAVLVAGVTSIVLGLVDIGLGAIPAEAQPVVMQAFNFLVVLLGAMGIHLSRK